MDASLIKRRRVKEEGLRIVNFFSIGKTQHLFRAIISSMFYVYVIQSHKTKDLYFGITSDFDKRLESHNQGKNQSTKFGVPWEFVYIESYRSEKDARVRERKLKHYGNARTYVKRRIKNSLL